MTLIGKVLLFFAIVWLIYVLETRLQIPVDNLPDLSSYKREKVADDAYIIGKSWIRKNDHGIWEMYLEGGPLERGITYGKLAEELVVKQEDAFIGQILELVPSRSYLRFLGYFVKWFNRDIASYIPEEYLREIYGVSLSASDDYDIFASKYERILNYHGAHDIGHALKDMSLVGCTSFSLWNSRSSDSSIIVGRNFDMYLGDKFAEDKILCFVKPDEGYSYMSVAWGGMIGVVSGMNDKGLAVTINAGRSDIPTGARTPVSLVIREILQYAASIEEAIAIAEKREMFVSESIVITSAIDNRAEIIEKSPEKTGFFKGNTNQLICANHFQSDVYSIDSLNQQAIRESASPYRQKRLVELLDSVSTVSYLDAARILRDMKGLNGKFIGYGNEKVMNQLICHHSIIMKPGKKQFWISTSPWQLGDFLAYDLNTVFSLNGIPSGKLSIDSLLIPSDPWINTSDYTKFVRYWTLKQDLQRYLWGISDQEPTEAVLKEFVDCNPELYHANWIAGECYYHIGMKDKAITSLRTALLKEVASVPEINKIEQLIEEIKEEIKQNQ